MRETRHLRRKKNKTPKRKTRTPKRKIRTPKRKTAVRSQRPKLRAREEWPLPRRTLKRKIRAKGPSGIDELIWDVAEPNKYSREEIEAAWILKNLSNEELNLSDSERYDYGKAMQKDPFKIINLMKKDNYISSDNGNKKMILLNMIYDILLKERNRIRTSP